MRGGRGRHPRNCHRFLALTSFLRVKGVNSHRDEAGRGRHPRNCHRFWALTSFLRVKLSTDTKMPQKIDEPHL